MLTGGGTAENITVSGSVSAKRGNGGIVGRMTVSGTISNCVNNATMVATGGANLGGIVGAAYYTAAGCVMNITNCTNYGTVTGSAGGVGGIVGLSSAHVSGCTNNAAVTASGASVGGVVGEQQNYGSVTNCINTASVTNNGASSAYGTGGIIGWVRYSGSAADYPLKSVVSVTGNENSGAISGGNDAGGIIGTVYHAANVNGNTNTAESLTAANFAAGIVANFQFPDNALIQGINSAIPSQEMNLQNNVSTTTIENITANCKNLYAYDNSSGQQEGKIEENSDAWVAQIGTTKYATLQTAIDAADIGETIILLDDITLDTGVAVAEDDKITLDLASYTVSLVVTDQITANNQLILNKGDLTITDSSENGTGKISYKFDGTANRDWAYAVVTISNQQGTLTIKGGTIESLSLSTNSDGKNTNVYKFTIDNLTNGSSGDATVNVVGGVITAAKGGSIRGFANSTADTCTIDIKDGCITGQVWLQDPSTNANKGVLSITGGEITANAEDVAAVYLYGNGDASGMKVSLGGDVVVNGSTYITSVDTTKAFNAEITGGTFYGDVWTCTWLNDDDTAVSAISGGNFSSPVDPAYLIDGVNAQLYDKAKNADAPYSYYESVEAALAAVVGEDAVVISLESDEPSVVNYYLVKYTDGADGEAFADQVYAQLEGDDTHAFEGNPARSGYTFTGWSPAVAETVTGSVIYTAQWEERKAEQPDFNFDYDYWYGALMMLYNQQFDITASATKGGTIDPAGISKVKYDKNITYTITPDKGYAIADVLVDGKSVGVVTEYTFKHVKEDQEIVAIFRQINPYTDVAETDVYFDAAWYLYYNDIMKGTDIENGLFSPDVELSRAMLVTILWRLEGAPVVNYLMQFEDVPVDEWYTEAVRWAASTGLVKGYGDNRFGPMDELTREQLCAVIYRYVQNNGGGFTGVWMYQMPHTDLADVSDWAFEAIAWMNMNGIYTGEGNALLPKAYAPRSLVAMMVYAMVDEE